MRSHGKGPIRRLRGRTLLTIGLAAALVTSACTGSGGDSAGPEKSAAPATMDPGPTCVKSEKGDSCLPIAPAGKRVDLLKPSFSNPTSITNRLHPTSEVDQTLYLGSADGEPFRSEVTLLPETKTIEWNGQRVTTVVSQYLAFAGGRIQEVALDWYAQADDGSVWYLGEDVFNYEDGVVADTEGTWLAGKDGPAAMIMPANPKVGDVYRPENIPGAVFEEVTVASTGQTVPGPAGPVRGAIEVSELHMDAGREAKVFAPGYGEFSTGNPAGDLEAAALAVPTDALPGPAPAQLTSISAAALTVFDAAGREDRTGGAAAQKAVQQAWQAYRSGQVPQMLGKQMSAAVAALTAAVTAEAPEEARQAALDVARASLDLRLRHQPVIEIDLARLALWARQLLIDTAAEEPGDIAGDAETLKWIWARVRHAMEPAAAARVDAQLRDLQGAAQKRNVAAAAKAAPLLLETLGTLRPR